MALAVAAAGHADRVTVHVAQADAVQAQALGFGQRAGGKAPGPIGRLFSKAFGSSRKATNKSASTGRRARGKLPL